MNDTVVIDSINYSTEAIQYVTLDPEANQDEVGAPGKINR